MSYKTNNFPNILLIIRTYILVICVFFIFRLILFLSEIDRINFSEADFSTIIQAFIMGVRFDIVISSYILLLPATIIFIFGLFGIESRILRNIIFYWVFILFTISFFISAADVPYFNQFYSRMSISAFEWLDNADFVFSMIIQESRYFLYILPFLLLTIIFFFFLKRVFRIKQEKIRLNLFSNILVSVLFLALMFLGIRGRIQEKAPISIGTAYFSNNSFLNKLGLNPVFTLMRSWLDSRKEDNATIQLMDNQMAINNIQKYLHFDEYEYNSPIARSILPDTSTDISQKYNIVIIIMENMSAAKMKRHGNDNNLTPFLDSISWQSYYFENIYSAGKHTYNGIFSTLFSFPGLYRQHPLKQIKKYDGISTTLLKHGYTTTYFTTHDSQFDNVEGFLRENDFQNIISQTDYPLSEIKTTLGVPDDYMFRYAIPEIDKLSELDKPFFVTMVTASDHGPYYIPNYFQPKSESKKMQIVEYADWSLQQFISLSSEKKWFDNTIFVFVADHGTPLFALYDISLNYFHTPLIFYAPKILKENKIFNFIGGQVDIFPTIMGLLKLPYINNTLGIDLINESRPYIIINDDDKIGVLDTTQFLILSKDNESRLYNYKDKDLTNYIDDYRLKANEMDIYARANMQVFQYMLLNNSTSLHNNDLKKQTD